MKYLIEKIGENDFKSSSLREVEGMKLYLLGMISLLKQAKLFFGLT